jgi:endonuclease-3 related protein
LKPMVPHLSLGKRFTEMFELLSAHFGSQNWWPADTALEMMVGAILTQNTNWGNVEGAIENLKEKAHLSLEGLASIPMTELAREIRAAGYFNVKARRLKNLIRFVFDEYDGDLTRLLTDETDSLRKGLLSVKGIGPETADSILLYAADRPVFVVDAYTYRILSRHGLVGEEVSYDEIQALFMDHLPHEVLLFKELHALIVQTGKTYCRSKPLCVRCPLGHWESRPSP